MGWIEDNKDSGPWSFEEQPDKWGYLNNPQWSTQEDGQGFCEDYDLLLNRSNQHLPCGHWHRKFVGYTKRIPYNSGKWVAAISISNTSSIYLYDIQTLHVIKLETTVEGVVTLAEVLDLNSAYDLNYDMGYGNPGAQRGGYCINKDETRLWYFFRGGTDGQLIEVDISQSVMAIVKKTTFPGLLPRAIQDGCSDNTYTYWCDGLIGETRIIKIRNSDHVLVDDHYFALAPLDWPNIEGTNTLDTYNNKLYWGYVKEPAGAYCLHTRSDNDSMTIDVSLQKHGIGIGKPIWQNMVRVYNNVVFQQRAYHPSYGYMYKRDSGTLISSANQQQEYLQNILGTDGGALFTLMHYNVAGSDSRLCRLNLTDLVISKSVGTSSYTVNGESSVSALNAKTQTIIIVRYNPVTEKNIVACFKADLELTFLSETALSHIVSFSGDNQQMILDEPQVWSMPD